MHSIQNEYLQIKIKETGAELSSIVAKGREYLWQGHADYWTGQAPVLFPFVGRLKDDFYLFEGKKYSLPQHGFFRRSNEIKLIEKSDTKLTFSLKHSEITLKNYPFEFEFQTSYELIENKIKIEHTVINLGAKTLYFSLGEHPAFNCSLLDSDTKHDECYLEFEKEESAAISLLAKGGYISNKTEECLKNTNVLDLPKSVFDKDALVFKTLKSKKVSLVNESEGKLVTLNYYDFPNLGIWAKPMAPYVCIEPWLGYADSINSNNKLEEKEGIISLDAKDNFNCSYSIEVHI